MAEEEAFPQAVKLRDPAKAVFIDQIATMEAHIQQIQRELAEKCSFIAVLEDTILNQNSLLEASESKIGMKTYEISSLIKELKDSGELIDTLNADVASARGENRTLTNKIVEAESQRDDLTKILEDQEVKNNVMESHIQEIESEFTNSCSFIATLEDTISNKNSLLETQTNEISRLTKESKDREEGIYALQADFAMAQEEIRAVRTQASESESQRVLSISMLSDKICNQNSLLEASESQILKKNSEITRLMKESKDSEEVINAMNADSTKLREELEFLRNHASVMESQRDTLSKSLSDVEMKNNATEDDFQEIKKELADKCFSIGTLEDKISSQNSLLEASESEILMKTEEISILTKEVKHCGEVIDATKVEVISLREEIRILRNQASERESQRDSLFKSLSDQEATNRGREVHIQEMEKELAKKSSWEDQISNQNSLLEASENEILKKTDEISRLIYEVKYCGEVINALNADVASLKAEHGSLRSLSSDTESERERLSKLLSDLQMKNNSMAGHIQEIKQELADKCVSVSLLEEKLSTQKSLLEASESEILTKTNEISRLIKEVKDCGELIDAMQGDATTANDKIGSLTKKASYTESQRDLLSKLVSDLELKNDDMTAHTEEIERELASKCLLVSALEEKTSSQISLLEASENEILLKDHEITRLMKESADSKEVINAINADVTSLSDELEFLRNHASDMESQRDTLSKSLSDVEMKNNVSEADIQEIKKELADKCFSIGTLEDKISSQNSLLEASESEMLKKNEEITRLTREAEDSEEVINAMNVDITSSRELHGALRKQASDVESQRDSVSKSLSALEMINNGMMTHIQEMEKELTDKCASISVLEEKVSSQKSLLESSESEILMKSSEISRLTKEVENCGEVINALNEDATAAHDKIGSLSGQASDIERQRDLLSKAVSDLEMKNNIMTAQTEEIEREFAVKFSLIATLENKISNQNTLLEASESEILMKADEISRLTKEVIDFNGLIYELRADVTSLRDELLGTLRNRATDTESQRELLSKMLSGLETETNGIEAQIKEIEKGQFQTDINGRTTEQQDSQRFLYQETEKREKEVTLEHQLRAMDDIIIVPSTPSKNAIASLEIKPKIVSHDHHGTSYMLTNSVNKSIAEKENRFIESVEKISNNGKNKTFLFDEGVFSQNASSQMQGAQMPKSSKRLILESNESASPSLPFIFQEAVECLAQINLISLLANLHLSSATGQLIAKFETINTDSDFVGKLPAASLTGTVSELHGARVCNGISPAQAMAVLLIELRREFYAAQNKSAVFISGDVEESSKSNEDLLFLTMVDPAGQKETTKSMQSSLEAYFAQIERDLNKVQLKISGETMVARMRFIVARQNKLNLKSTLEDKSCNDEDGMKGEDNVTDLNILTLSPTSSDAPIKRQTEVECPTCIEGDESKEDDRGTNLRLPSLLGTSNVPVESKTKIRQLLSSFRKSKERLRSTRQDKSCNDDDGMKGGGNVTDLNILTLSPISSEAPIKPQTEVECPTCIEGEETKEDDRATNLRLPSLCSTSNVTIESKTKMRQLLSSFRKSKERLSLTRQDKSRNEEDETKKEDNVKDLYILTLSPDTDALTETQQKLHSPTSNEENESRRDDKATILRMPSRSSTTNRLVESRTKIRQLFSSLRKSKQNLISTRQEKFCNEGDGMKEEGIDIDLNRLSRTPSSDASQTKAECPACIRGDGMNEGENSTEVRQPSLFSKLDVPVESKMEQKTILSSLRENSIPDSIGTYMHTFRERGQSFVHNATKNVVEVKVPFTEEAKHRQMLENVVNVFFGVGVNSENARNSLINRTLSEAELLDFMEKAVESRQYERLQFMADFFKEGTVSRATVQSKSKVVWMNDCHPLKDLTYAISIDEDKKRVMVVFGGLKTGSDLGHAIDLSFQKTPNPVKDAYEGRKDFIKLHRGFFLYLFRKDAETCKYDEITNVVDRYGREIGDDYKVFVTGHSLGGALATMFSFFASTEERFTKNCPLKCITFEAPMVGGYAFADSFMHQERNQKLMFARVYSSRDLVVGPHFIITLVLVST